MAVRTMVAVAAGAELTLAYTNLAQPRARCGARTCLRSRCKHVLLHLLAAGATTVLQVCVAIGHAHAV